MFRIPANSVRVPDFAAPMSSTKNHQKFFYRIEEVSRITRLDKRTIEEWEKEFPFLQPGITGSGQKIFRAKDVEIMKRIKALLDQKNVTLAGARRRIEEEFGFKPAAAVHPDKLMKALRQVRGQLQDISLSLEKGPKKV
jgi:DNA-binding transcriptional MerR regulator